LLLIFALRFFVGFVGFGFGAFGVYMAKSELGFIQWSAA